MATAILQARMSSSRLPGKVMKPLAGGPMIERQIERLRRCETLTRLVVATSTEPSDDALAAHLATIGVEVFRGPLEDVLGRFVTCVQALKVEDDLVRLTADCPLIDPEVVDACVRLRADSGADYCTNGRVRTYPRGLDVEAFTLEALLSAGREATSAYDREHVTPYLYAQGSRFTQAALTQARDESDLRWTVDTPDDYAFVARVYEALYPGNPAFTSDDIRGLPFQRYEREA
ncbi:cytidylyltransferase domain-containing protein [Phenylobacterium sp.]|uniref:cytidylyltransferase domain-containing protein n=1 Tax=Phenylobacterium sp. TaxID=1871053 RepID=UPI0035AF6AF3